MKRDDLLFIAYILAVTAFAFLFWHNKVAWDPCAYMLTGKRLLGENTYYEALRAPIPSLLNATLGFQGYIVAVTFLFGASLYIYARRKGFDPLLLIALFLPALSWPYFVETGTELLAFSFILLGAAFSEAAYAGVLFSLAFLSRYAFVYFIPFFLPWRQYAKGWKLAGIHLLGFGVPLIMWSIWQHLAFGHPLASYIDFLYVNSYLNPTTLKIPRIDHLLRTTLPTTVLGLFGMNVWTGLMLIAALLFAGIALVQWPRFYIPALLPLSLSAARVDWPKNLKYVLLLSNIAVAFIFVYPVFSWDSKSIYATAVEKMDANCTYISNVWVPLICMGGNAIAPPPGAENNPDLQQKYVEMLEEGYKAVVMRGVGFPAYMEDMNIYKENNIPVKDYDRFFIAGKGCIPPANLWEKPENAWEFYNERLLLILSR